VDAIADMGTYLNYRPKFVLKHITDEEILVSREKLHEFKAWPDK
jgi:hypothetical protein